MSLGFQATPKLRFSDSSAFRFGLPEKTIV